VDHGAEKLHGLAYGNHHRSCRTRLGQSPDSGSPLAAATDLVTTSKSGVAWNVFSRAETVTLSRRENVPELFGPGQHCGLVWRQFLDVSRQVAKLSKR
jgi:hypothetical protein